MMAQVLPEPEMVNLWQDSAAKDVVVLGTVSYINYSAF